MSKAIGGFVRRKDRIQGSIGHLRPDCPYCGILYADVKEGKPHYIMDGLHPVYHPPMPMNFLSFDVETDK